MQCKYVSQLLFLTDKTANKPTVSNVSITIKVKIWLKNQPAPLELQPSTSTPTKRKSMSQSYTNDNINLTQAFSGSAKKLKPLPDNHSQPSQSSQPKKCRAELAHSVDSMLVKTLQDMQNNGNRSEDLEAEDDEHCSTVEVR